MRKVLLFWSLYFVGCGDFVSAFYNVDPLDISDLSGFEAGIGAGLIGGFEAGYGASIGGFEAGYAGTPAGMTGGNPDPELCQDACNSFVECAVSVCTGYQEADNQRIIDDYCITNCQDSPSLATLFNQQESCEGKVGFASVIDPNFATACTGTSAGMTGGNPDPTTLCQDTCNLLHECAISVCADYQEADHLYIIDGCVTICQDEPNLVMIFNQQQSCEDQVSFASEIIPDFGAACTNAGTMDPIGACTDDANEEILVSIERSTFVNIILSCYGFADVTTCATPQIQEATGLSSECSTCFGEAIVCTTTYCIGGGQCLNDANNSNPECVQCISDNCGEAFLACSGRMIDVIGL